MGDLSEEEPITFDPEEEIEVMKSLNAIACRPDAPEARALYQAIADIS